MGRTNGYIPAVFVARIDGSHSRLLFSNQNVSPFSDITWSPDGVRFAFPVLGPKAGIVDAATGRIAFVDDADSAILSRQPRRVAVISERSTLDIVNLDGGRVRVASDVGFADWSQDGRFAATASYDFPYTLTVRDLRAHTVLLRVHLPVVGLRFSPDARRIALLVGQGGRQQLAVLDVASGKRVTLARRLLVGANNPVQRIAWAPHGGEVAVATGGAVVVCTTSVPVRCRTLGTAQPVQHPSGPPRWVGAHVVLFTIAWSNDRELYALDPATSQARVLTHDNVDERTPALSSNGTLIAFERGGWVYVRPFRGGRERRLRRGFDPAWSPTGDLIAVDDGQNIELLDARTGALRRKLADGIEPAWAPDGSTIAFTRNGDIWAAAADGSAQHPITKDGFAVPERMPAYSPDGLRIAYRAVAPGGVGIFTADAADGANVTRVTNGGRDPSWSPDGTKLVFELDGELAVVDADGSNEHVIAESNGWSGEPSWGP
jgi:TolB protein